MINLKKEVKEINLLSNRDLIWNMIWFKNKNLKKRNKKKEKDLLKWYNGVKVILLIRKKIQVKLLVKKIIKLINKIKIIKR